MDKKLKDKYLNAKSIDELSNIEDEEMGQLRNQYYGEVLKDDDIKRKIIELFNITEDMINNALMINGAVPLDYDEDMDESKILFDDMELENFKGEEGETLNPIVDKETQKKINKEIKEILDEISTQI